MNTPPPREARPEGSGDGLCGVLDPRVQPLRDELQEVALAVVRRTALGDGGGRLAHC